MQHVLDLLKCKMISLFCFKSVICYSINGKLIQCFLFYQETHSSTITIYGNYEDAKKLQCQAMWRQSIFAQPALLPTLHIYFLVPSPNQSRKRFCLILEIWSKCIYTNVSVRNLNFFSQIVEGKLCLMLKEEEKIFWSQGVLLRTPYIEGQADPEDKLILMVSVMAGSDGVEGF